MTQVPSAAQAALLKASLTSDGTIGADTARRATITAAVKNGWLSTTKAGDGERLAITSAGREAVGAGPPTTSRSEPKGKIAILIALMRADGGATIDAMMSATGWQAHSVRGAISGAIKKSAGFQVVSEKTEAGRIYSLPTLPEA
jgi:hypothetical protein